MTFATVVILQAHTSYMWDVESRRSQVRATALLGLFTNPALRSIVGRITLDKQTSKPCFAVAGAAVVRQQGF